MPTLLLAVALLVGAEVSATHATAAREHNTTIQSARLQATLNDDILARAFAAHMARMEGIENYTVVQSVMGIETTTYFERVMVDGKPQYRSHTVTAAGQQFELGEASDEDVYTALAAYSSRATVKGTDTVDGHRVNVLVIEDVSGLPGMNTEDMGDVEFTKATLYLDSGNHVMRRMEMEGTRTEGGQASPVTATMNFEDYRDVSGMLHPFRTVMSFQGAAGSLSEKELEEARASLAQLKEQMQSMPASQRSMMESVLGPRIEQFESMVGGESMEFVIEVKEVLVNAGPPA